MPAQSSLYTKQNNTGPAIYYDSTFRYTLQAHLTYLTKDSGAVIRAIDPQIAYRYENDLYGLLMFMGIPIYLHWLIMRMNGMTSPFQYTPDKLLLATPSTDTVDTIQALYTSTQTIQ